MAPLPTLPGTAARLLLTLALGLVLAVTLALTGPPLQARADTPSPCAPPAGVASADSVQQARCGGKPLTVRQRADIYMFKSSITTFMNVKRGRDPRFNWSDDGCSVPKGIRTLAKKRMKQFDQACKRHDFGYRNYGKATKGGLRLNPTEAQRSKIDGQLLKDARAACDSIYKKGKGRNDCRGGAASFYLAVNGSKGGKKAFFG